MEFDISYDAEGKPYHVSTNDGFCMTSRPYDPEQDGWMLEQLDPSDFPIIQAGRDMAALVAEVNYLRRKLWSSEKSDSLFRQMAGSGFFGNP